MIFYNSPIRRVRNVYPMQYRGIKWRRNRNKARIAQRIKASCAKGDLLYGLSRCRKWNISVLRQWHVNFLTNLENAFTAIHKTQRGSNEVRPKD